MFDFKYDGFRDLCYIEQGRGRFLSRNCNTLSRFEALGDEVAAALDVDDVILDGEVIATDETGRPQFYDLIRRTRTPTYVAFDILWLDYALCRSASAGSGYKRFCRRDRRSFPRRFRSSAGAVNSSS